MASMIDAHLAAELPEAEVSRIALAPSEEIGDDGARREVAHGEAIHVRMRPDAPIQVLFTGHYDTVYPADSTFQEPRVVETGVMNGPGVTDMKGGVLVMLEAARALETHSQSGTVGYQILLSPDEEIGSPASAPHLARLAKQAHLGMTYEPATSPEGMLAGARKGSGNFTAVARGRAAHAGRAPEAGRNAIALLAEFVGALTELHGARDGLTVNPARITGGGPYNVVPDQAVLRFNIRVAAPDDQSFVETNMRALEKAFSDREGFALTIHGVFQRPPKVLDARHEALFEAMRRCGADLGQDLAWRPTGGCCEGNNLAAAGLPNIDTLGVRGGAIHSENEFLIMESLAERAQLSALFLMRLAEGDFPELTKEVHGCAS